MGNTRERRAKWRQRWRADPAPPNIRPRAIRAEHERQTCHRHLLRDSTDPDVWPVGAISLGCRRHLCRCYLLCGDTLGAQSPWVFRYRIAGSARDFATATSVAAGDARLPCHCAGRRRTRGHRPLARHRRTTRICWQERQSGHATARPGRDRPHSRARDDIHDRAGRRANDHHTDERHHSRYGPDRQYRRQGGGRDRRCDR